MQFRVVWDQLAPCTYLPDRPCRLPLRLPRQALDRPAFDTLLAEGERRNGRTLYRPTCDGCSACEAIRLPIDRVRLTDSQRRSRRRNEGVLAVEEGEPVVDEAHLRIYNRHRRERGLIEPDAVLDADGYRHWFVSSCVQTRELRYLLDGELAAVSILDLGERAVSSVYHYFNPDLSARGLGVYSVVHELERYREQGFLWYYLGYYVEGSVRVRYKATWWPHQRLRAGCWWEYPAPGEPPVLVEGSR